MARRLELYYESSSVFETIETKRTITVNLLNGVLRLADGGWESESSDDPLWETFTLLAVGTDSQIREEQDRIDTLMEYARRFIDDPKEAFPVLLRVQSEGESMKQSVIADIRYKYHADSNMTPLLGENTQELVTAQLMTLAVLRTPVFEPPDSELWIASNTSISDLGGKWVIGNANGVRPQRILYLQLDDPSADVYEHTKFWIGIRQLRYGVSGFEPKWEAESGTNITADTTDVADAGASGGNKIRIDFTTYTTLEERAYFRVTEFSADEVDMVGKYLVLGRVKLDAGTTEVHLQIRQGYMAYRNLNEITGDVYLSAVQDSNLTNWNLVELGTVEMPSTPARDMVPLVNGGMDQYGFSVYAERMSVAGNIEIDCFILIPVDHFAILTDCKVGKDTGQVSIHTTPLNEQYALGGKLAGSTDLFHTINYNLGNWGYPAEGGVLVLAGQGATSHDLSRVLRIGVAVIPRFKMYRI